MPALKAKASGLTLETFAEQVLLEKIHDKGTQPRDSSVADAARRLGSFGKRQGLSLGGMTIKELLIEAGSSGQPTRDEFAEDVVNDVMPCVEKNYRAFTDRPHTAPAGLSTGGDE